MRNTTKLKYLLQLYNVSLEMDDDENLHFTITEKRNGERETFIDKTYSIVVGKAFVHMNKKLKAPL
jgi:hypothetical protein